MYQDLMNYGDEESGSAPPAVQPPDMMEFDDGLGDQPDSFLSKLLDMPVMTEKEFSGVVATLPLVLAIDQKVHQVLRLWRNGQATVAILRTTMCEVLKSVSSSFVSPGIALLITSDATGESRSTHAGCASGRGRCSTESGPGTLPSTTCTSS